MKTLNLCLHCGGQAVDIADVRSVKTPDSTKSWMPIAHTDLIERVTEVLPNYGLRVGATAHALSHEGHRYFGLMQILREKTTAADYTLVLGLRNSHDKTFPAAIVAGASVFVCDNLAFNGEVKLARKHTTHILRDLPSLVNTGIGKVMEKWNHQEKRVEAYKNFEMDDRDARALLVSAVEAEALPRTELFNALDEWRRPRHKDFEPRNAWSLFNACTEILKGRSLESLSRRTELLHGLLDSNIGLGAHSLN